MAIVVYASSISNQVRVRNKSFRASSIRRCDWIVRVHQIIQRSSQCSGVVVSFRESACRRRIISPIDFDIYCSMSASLYGIPTDGNRNICDVKGGAGW